MRTVTNQLHAAYTPTIGCAGCIQAEKIITAAGLCLAGLVRKELERAAGFTPARPSNMSLRKTLSACLPPGSQDDPVGGAGVKNPCPDLDDIAADRGHVKVLPD